MKTFRRTDIYGQRSIKDEDIPENGQRSIKDEDIPENGHLWTEEY